MIDPKTIRTALKKNRFIIGQLQARELDNILLFFVSKGGGTLRDIEKNKQLLYIYGYLEELKILLNKEEIYFVAEPNYIDRDFIDDFARFYSKCMRPYPNKCLRVHFFTYKINRRVLTTVIKQSRLEECDRKKLKILQDNYLGFAIFKPLAQTFVGRTVLKVYPPKATRNRERHYKCVREYDVNLAGIHLKVEGLAFQQQDATIGACATTAIWCGLHKAAYDAKYTVPTPWKITESATRYLVPLGRQFPSRGLTIEQICEGIRSFDLAPELIPVSSSPNFMREVFHSYLSSGIPVIACLRFYDKLSLRRRRKTYYLLSQSKEGHAITFLGYRTDKRIVPFRWLKDERNRPRAAYFEALEMDELYAHDDRLGPYLRVEFPKRHFLEDHLLSDKYKKIVGDNTKKKALLEASNLKVYRSEHAFDFDLVLVTHLIVPVYPKLRLNYEIVRKVSILRLLALNDYILEGDQSASGEPLPRFENFHISYSFPKGKEYLRFLQKELLVVGFKASQIRQLLETLRLPRQVGLCRVNLYQSDRSKRPFLDLLFDTTESLLGWPIFGVILKDERLLTFERALRDIFRTSSIHYPR